MNRIAQLKRISSARLQEGKIGYMFLWLLGVPIPVLFMIVLLRKCDKRQAF